MITRLACLPLLAMPVIAMAGSWSDSSPEYPTYSSLDASYLSAANASQQTAGQSNLAKNSLLVAKVAAFFVTGHYIVSPTLSLTYQTEPADNDIVSKAEACGRLGLHLRF